MTVELFGAAESRLRLSAVPVNLRTELRTNFRAAANPIVSDMRSRAARSSRIPGAISVQSKFGVRSAGVYIRVSSAKAPNARALNNKGRGGTFRHPVFGNRKVWVDQPAMPFFEPAAAAGRTGVIAAAQLALRSVTLT